MPASPKQTLSSAVVTTAAIRRRLTLEKGELFTTPTQQQAGSQLLEICDKVIAALDKAVKAMDKKGTTEAVTGELQTITEKQFFTEIINEQ